MASSALVVAAGHLTVAASCTTGKYPSAAVTGVVVSTSIDPDQGVFVEVRSDDGAPRTVVFYGRNPNNKLPDGSENTVEDSWPGELPAVGGLYTITGAEFEGPDGPLGVNVCAESASVAALAAAPATADQVTEPATSTATVSSTAVVNQSSNGGGWSLSSSVAAFIGVLLGVAAIVLIVRRRAPTTRA
jgi:hypothetical protein